MPVGFLFQLNTALAVNVGGGNSLASMSVDGCAVGLRTWYGGKECVNDVAIEDGDGSFSPDGAENRVIHPGDDLDAKVC